MDNKKNIKDNIEQKNLIEGVGRTWTCPQLAAAGWKGWWASQCKIGGLDGMCGYNGRDPHSPTSIPVCCKKPAADSPRRQRFFMCGMGGHSWNPGIRLCLMDFYEECQEDCQCPPRIGALDGPTNPPDAAYGVCSPSGICEKYHQSPAAMTITNCGCTCQGSSAYYYYVDKNSQGKKSCPYWSKPSQGPCIDEPDPITEKCNRTTLTTGSSCKEFQETVNNIIKTDIEGGDSSHIGELTECVPDTEKNSNGFNDGSSAGILKSKTYLPYDSDIHIADRHRFGASGLKCEAVPSNIGDTLFQKGCDPAKDGDCYGYNMQFQNSSFDGGLSLWNPARKPVNIDKNGFIEGRSSSIKLL